jgi:hypothetical protein
VELSALRRAIPAAIDAMGGDSRVSALGDDAWAIFRGSAVGYVALIGGGEEEGDPVVHVSFPIIRVPETGAEALFKRLLELNHELGSLCSFSIDQRGKVWLGAARFAADLDEPALRELIAHLAVS